MSIRSIACFLVTTLNAVAVTSFAKADVHFMLLELKLSHQLDHIWNQKLVPNKCKT